MCAINGKYEGIILHDWNNLLVWKDQIEAELKLFPNVQLIKREIFYPNS